ncbi:MAG: hypothetical protein KGM43_11535 [Planctomycetota bacterium]|nr:hypothetical protein [Planctomycetota bacterium]
MPDFECYWIVHPNGYKQRIDPGDFDLAALAARARKMGGELIVERPGARPDPRFASITPPTWIPLPPPAFEPPISALRHLFRGRFDRIYTCLVDYELEIVTRATSRTLGGYYKSERLIRVYAHDRELGRRPLEELFDTFLHELAHHLEYTEPDSFHARACERVPGRMHSTLFWRILGDLKARWAKLQHQERVRIRSNVDV